MFVTPRISLLNINWDALVGRTYSDLRSPYGQCWSDISILGFYVSDETLSLIKF